MLRKSIAVKHADGNGVREALPDCFFDFHPRHQSSSILLLSVRRRSCRRLSKVRFLSTPLRVYSFHKKFAFLAAKAKFLNLETGPRRVDTSDFSVISAPAIAFYCDRAGCCRVGGFLRMCSRQAGIVFRLIFNTLLAREFDVYFIGFCSLCIAGAIA